MWIPAEFCDGGEGGSGKGGDVRGERVLEVGLEDEDLKGEGDWGMGFGVRVVVGWVWSGVERAGLVLQRGMKRVGKVQELDDGHDGDL